MNRLKEYLSITVMAFAILLITGVAKAEQTTTFSDFVNAWAKVPGAIVNHVKAEALDIQAYQQKSWAEMKQKWPFKQDSSQ